DIEPDVDTRLPGSLGKHPAVIDKGLVASGLQVDWRESSEIRVEWAGIWIAPGTVAGQNRRQPLHGRLREKGILLTVGHEARSGGRQIEPARHDHCGRRLREASIPSSLQHANSQNRASGLSGDHDVFGLNALVQQPPIHGYCSLKLGRMFSFVCIRKLEE